MAEFLEGGNSKKEGYISFLSKRFNETLENPEFEGVRRWFKERVKALPEMEVTETALTGEGGWSHEMTTDGENIKRVNGKFFKIEGRNVTLRKADGSVPFKWNQPAIIQGETPINLTTKEGNINVEAAGFVGIIRDEQDNFLLTVGQEPLADTEKKALARTPFQTSVAKLQGLLEGKNELDPVLAETLTTIGQGKSISEMFATGDIDVFPLALADGNRIKATNFGFVTTVKDAAVRDKLTADGKNRWCTRQEAKALANAGLINGHTVAALFAIT